MERVCIAADIGGTNLRCALVTERGVVLRREQHPTETSSTEGFLAQLAGSLAGLREFALQSGMPVTAVGLGVPGLVSGAGAIHSSVNLLCIEGVGLAAELSRRTALPVLALNDANAGALGEHRYGAARSYRSLLHVTIGTGVGAGLILDGRLWTGIDGAAGEFGHVTVEPEGRPCGCGNRGCLEQYLSATAIAAAGSGCAAPDAAAVAAAALKGDEAALAIFEQAGSYLGIAVAGVLNLLNLEAVVLGGGVARSFALLAPAMRREIAARAFPVPRRRARILCSELGDNAGLLGAAAAAFDAAKERGGEVGA